MSTTFDPIKTWLRYGISDLYFGFANQANDVFRYGTFFYIMAAEKHLKAVLIENNKAKYLNVSKLTDKRIAVNQITKGYSHNFKQMIDEVSVIYQRETGKEFVAPTVDGYDVAVLVQSMQEGYMETRYPVVTPTFRQYPFPNAKNMYHDPLGSSFFTDFVTKICQVCWQYLVLKGVDSTAILSSIEEQYESNKSYSTFKAQYIATL